MVEVIIGSKFNNNTLVWRNARNGQHKHRNTKSILRPLVDSIWLPHSKSQHMLYEPGRPSPSSRVAKHQAWLQPHCLRDPKQLLQSWHEASICYASKDSFGKGHIRQLEVENVLSARIVDNRLSTKTYEDAGWYPPVGNCLIIPPVHILFYRP